MSTSSHSPSFRFAGWLSLMATAVVLTSAVASAHGPTGTTYVAPLPNLNLDSQLILASLVGPPVGVTVAHATLDITFQTNGVFPASELELEFEMYDDSGTKNSWIVSGADMGWSSGSGTHTATIGTDNFNGVAWHFLAPDAIIDFSIATTTGMGGVTGKLTASTLTFDLGTAWDNYCTAGTSASGCAAQLSATGLASATASTGFQLSATSLEGAKDGLFFFGTNGQQANPWGTGTSFQCVVPPVMRASLLAGTGSPGLCDGSLAQDLNALWCPSCPKPSKNPGAGAVVQAQLWYRDPFNTSNQTTSLSNAIEFSVCP